MAGEVHDLIIDVMPPAYDEVIVSGARDPVLVEQAPTEVLETSRIVYSEAAPAPEFPVQIDSQVLIGEDGQPVFIGPPEYTPEEQARNLRNYNDMIAGRRQYVQDLYASQGGGLFSPFERAADAVSDTVRNAIDVFTQVHLPHAAFLAPELLQDDSIVYDVKNDVRAELPKELQQVADFEEINFNLIKDTLLENPERLLYGSADPLSTALWNEILGTEHVAVINQFGGPSPEAFMLAESRGVDTSISQISHEVAAAIAGVIGGGAAGEALAPLLSSASSSILGAAEGVIGGSAGGTAGGAIVGGTAVEGAALLAPVIVTGSNAAALIGAGLGVGAGAVVGNAAGSMPTSQPIGEPVAELSPVVVTGSNALTPTLTSALASVAGANALPDITAPDTLPSEPVDAGTSSSDDPEMFSEEWWRAMIEEKGYPWVRAQLARLLAPQQLSQEQFDAYQQYLDDLAAREGYTSHASIGLPALLALAGAALFVLS